TSACPTVSLHDALPIYGSRGAHPEVAAGCAAIPEDRIVALTNHGVSGRGEAPSNRKRLLHHRLLERDDQPCIARLILQTQSAEGDRKSTRLNSSHQIIS